jgi:hypothetical protein
VKFTKLFIFLLVSVTQLSYPIPQYYCTSADKEHFELLLNLIGSIHKTNFGNLQEIAVFDLGFTKKQCKLLQTINKVQVYNLEKTNPQMFERMLTGPTRKVRGCFTWKPVAIKQGLELFPYMLYLDAGISVLQPLDTLFEHIENKGYFLVDCGHDIACRLTKNVLHNIINEQFSEHKHHLLSPNALSISAGMQGLSRKVYDDYVLPIYQLSSNISIFEDDGSSPLGLGAARHDQPLYSIYANIQNFDISLQGWIPLESKNNPLDPIHVHWDSQALLPETSIFISQNGMRYKFKDFIKFK